MFDQRIYLTFIMFKLLKLLLNCAINYKLYHMPINSHPEFIEPEPADNLYYY